MNNKKNVVISLILVVIFIAFTFMVKLIDVQEVGVNNTCIGFAGLNTWFFEWVGVNILWYHITDWLGLFPVLLAICYAHIGFVQLIKRKRVSRVDKEIILLGAFYVMLVGVYIFFEKVIINYRPILMGGFLEASYPSSHTIMALTICGSSIIINNKLYRNRFTRVLNVLSLFVMAITVFGRLISGVHWLTDILGGIILSATMLMIFYALIQNINHAKS